jgi:hypothetical protein
MKQAVVIQVLLSFIFIRLNAQDSVLATRLLQRIEQLQAKESSVFPKGIFPSYRTYALNKDRDKADINAFYTGLICFTLRDLKPKLSPAQCVIVDSIIARARPVYDKFKNRKGRPVYNFWPTDTLKIFPNAGWLNLFDKKQSLPDDMDDTVIFLLAQNAPDSTARKVHALMQAYTNLGQGEIRNTYRSYSDIKAYSTWFGKKMPVDFDVCVLSNILNFVQRYKLPWQAGDSASLQLIEKVISERRYMEQATYVSPHYQLSSVILYHLSRLMSVRPIPELEKYRGQLIQDTEDLLAGNRHFMEQVILQTALLRWGVQPPTQIIRTDQSLQELTEENNFTFFIANMASILPNPLKQWMAVFGKFYYDCDAYNNLLLLENILLSRRNH